MGQTLSEPVVEKISASGEDERLAYGVTSMQGWRVTMEDAHAAVLDLQNPEGSETTGKQGRLSFFGVYDGHGGEGIALFSGENLHKVVAKQPTFQSGDYEQALKNGFLATDRAILQDSAYGDDVSGCTACVALVSDTHIYCANAGDSRCVLGVKGRAKPLSFDHKPQNPDESARIRTAGGYIDFGRVNGNLALSRAIGDFEFKKNAKLPPEEQMVTAYPDVNVSEITDDDEFIVIACDGIWDCRSSQAVVEFVRRGITAKQELHVICGNLMDNCLALNSETAGVGCDNMTMVIVALLRGKTKEEWYDLIAKRVAGGDGPCAPPEYAEFKGYGKNPAGFLDDDSPDEFDVTNPNTRLGNDTTTLPTSLDASDSDDDYGMSDEEETKEEDDEALNNIRSKGKGKREGEGAEDDSSESERGKENAKIDSTLKPLGIQQDTEGQTNESTTAK